MVGGSLTIPREKEDTHANERSDAMSLTSFVERADVREQLAQVLPTYRRRLDVPLLVPSRTANPALIGTAFDYAFRFELQRRNAAAKGRLWVAEASVLLLSAPELSASFVTPGMPQGRLTKLASEAVAVVADARKFERRFASLKAPGARHRTLLAHHALRLARLDVVRRAHVAEGALDPPTDIEVAEVAELVARIPPEIGLRGRVSLNPGFGDFSALVDGADADLIANATLIEIKTTKAAIIEKEMVRQLVGYLILARAAMRVGQKLPRFDKVAVYLSRHAYLWPLSIAPIVTHARWDETEGWFLATAKSASTAASFTPNP
jgi:hypothetical protein